MTPLTLPPTMCPRQLPKSSLPSPTRTALSALLACLALLFGLHLVALPVSASTAPTTISSSAPESSLRRAPTSTELRAQRQLAPRYAVLVVLGLGLLFWGFRAAHLAAFPLDVLGSISAPVGLLLALVGALLICVPDFFQS